VLAAYVDAAVDSPHTRRAYARHVTDAMLAFGVSSLAELNGAMLASWRPHVAGSPVSPASHSQALAALRSFLGWAGTMGAHRIPAEVIRATLRTPRSSVTRPYHVLSEPEIGELLATAFRRADPLARDRPAHRRLSA
jgi:site-specific recombinase XerD